MSSTTTHTHSTLKLTRRLWRLRQSETMRALVRDSEALLRATASDVSEKAQEARARMTAAMERAKATCQELQAQGLESAQAAARKADDTIRAHPYESLGIAFGVGLLIGALMRRR